MATLILYRIFDCFICHIAVGAAQMSSGQRMTAAPLFLTDSGMSSTA
jgi:hypothetical protein